MKCFVFDFFSLTDPKNIQKIALHYRAENKLKAMREVFDTKKSGFRLCLHKPYYVNDCQEHYEPSREIKENQEKRQDRPSLDK